MLCARCVFYEEIQMDTLQNPRIPEQQKTWFRNQSKFLLLAHCSWSQTRKISIKQNQLLERVHLREKRKRRLSIKKHFFKCKKPINRRNLHKRKCQEPFLKQTKQTEIKVDRSNQQSRTLRYCVQRPCWLNYINFQSF